MHFQSHTFFYNKVRISATQLFQDHMFPAIAATDDRIERGQLNKLPEGTVPQSVCGYCLFKKNYWKILYFDLSLLSKIGFFLGQHFRLASECSRSGTTDGCQNSLVLIGLALCSYA